MFDDLSLKQARSWLLAPDHPDRRQALVGCTLDDTVSDAEWLIEAVEGTILRLIDIDDEDGTNLTRRDLLRLSQDAIFLLPDDLPDTQRALLAEALGPAPSPEDQANRDLLTAMGIDPDEVGGQPWQKHIAAVARSTEQGVPVPMHALEALQRHLTLLKLHRPAIDLLTALADDDPVPLTRATARLFAAEHWRTLRKPERALAMTQPLTAGHRHLPQALLSKTLVLRANALCDVGDTAAAEKTIRWAWATAQTPEASAVFQRLKGAEV